MTIEIVAAEWGAACAVAGTTTRSGGVSEGAYRSLNLAAHVGDRPQNVRENRRRLVAHAQLPAEPLWLNQVHGSDVVYAEEAAAATTPLSADAIVSRDGSHVLGILTADCLPIVLCSRSSAAIAALHCGWRSLSGGIVAAAVNAMTSAPAELSAWLGPAISASAFEVGDEVRDAFLAGIEDAASCFRPNAAGRWQADLYRLARLYLGATGVERVCGGGLCTLADAGRFFSHRRDGRCGRMATFVYNRT